MDVVTLQGAKRYADGVTPSHLALITSRLQSNNENVVLAVLGDSTGVGTTRWPYLVATWLASQYPAYTVAFRNWNDTNQNYDAATTIQTGSGTGNAGGPFTLTIYNGSTSGQNALYSTTRIALQVPATPHVIIVNYGHNEGSTTGTAYRPLLYDLTRRLEDNFPSAGLVLTAQNPRVATDPTYTFDVARQQATIDLAGSEGYGLVNVQQAFLNDASYATDLLNVDGLHPNDTAGSPLWAALVQRQLLKAVNVTPRAMLARPHRIWLPASAFAASEGSPTLSVTGPASAQFQAWAMDPTTQAGLVVNLDYPESWQSVNVYIVWAGPTGSGYTGSTNGVRWETAISRLPTTGPFPSPATQTTVGTPNNFAFTATTTSTVTNSGAYTHVLHRTISGGAYAYRPLTLRIRRIAADAADTLAENALVRGVYIERAS